jgi:cytochrome c-type biogenesis protein CcmH
VKRPANVLLLMMFMLLASPVPAAAEDVYSPRTLEIARRLQCPVCAGQPVADSNSELARQMRAIIEQKVQAGESDQQIIDFFVERYGQSVLVDPPKSGIGVGLWWMPVLVVTLGAVVVFTYLKERHGATPVGTDEPDSDDELEAIAREVLGSGNGEVVRAP